MSIRKLSLAVLLVILPAAAVAQGRGFRAAGGAKEADAMIRDMSESPSLSKDLQKANPIEFLLDNKKVLQLTSDEEKELKAINGSVKESIKPYLKTIDSVSREMKKTGDFAPTQGQMLLGRRLTREMTDSVMATYQSAGDQGISKLAESRRQPASDMLQKQVESMVAGRRGGRPPV